MHLAFEGDYRYDPIYHGPVQYAMVATAFRLLGDSDFTARLPAALGGVALVALALALRRRFGERTAFGAGLLLALSPNLLYYTRFCREDIWSLLGTAGLFLSFDAWWRGRRLRHLILCALSAALAFAAKENFYVLVALMGPALLCTALAPGSPIEPRRRVREFVAFLEENAFALAGAFLLFFIVSELFYTFLLVHPDSGNPAREAISYWWGQHKAERVGGPKWFYLPRLAQYEFAILAPAFCWLVSRRRRGLDGLDRILTVLGLLALSLAVVPGEGPLVSKFRPLLPFLSFAALGFVLLCRTERRAERFLAGWGLSSLLMYAYLGEKTPWLIVHQILPFVALSALAWARLVEKTKAKTKAPVWHVAGGLTAAASIVSALSLAFWHPVLRYDDPRVESVVYVQTAPDLRGPIAEVLAAAPKGGDPIAAVVGEPTWPLSWYFRHLAIDWTAPTPERRPPFVFTDPEKAAEIAVTLGAGYTRTDIPLRIWWLPSVSREPLSPRPKELVRYLFTRIPWRSVDSPAILGDQPFVLFRNTEENRPR